MKQSKKDRLHNHGLRNNINENSPFSNDLEEDFKLFFKYFVIFL